MKKAFRRLCRIIALPVLILFILIYAAAIALNALRGSPFQPYNAHITVVLVQAMRMVAEVYYVGIVVCIACYLISKAIPVNG